MKTIYNASDIIQANNVIALLKTHGISAYCQDSPNGIIAHGTPGFGAYGVDILVDDSDERKAISIIELMSNKHF